MPRCLWFAPLLLSLPAMAQFASTNGVGGPMRQETNNPVSLVFERKQTQTLADGTHISSTTHEYFYRDTLGRTRTENEFPMLRGTTQATRMVSVMDPVAGTVTNWQTGAPGAGNAHEYTRVSTNPQQGTLRQRPAQAQGITTSTPTHIVAESTLSAPPMHPQVKREDLGVQDVQGATCQASRTTIVLPTGFLGNDRPITTTQESCVSTEFGQALKETYDDPRSGTRTTTMQSISRGEPDPSLFQPPPGYTERVPQESH